MSHRSGVVTWAALAAAAGVLAGCAAPERKMPPPPVCTAERVQHHLGKVYREELGERLRFESGAKRVRVLKHGDAATLEYDRDRLNVILDRGDSKISRLNCG